MLPIRQRDLDAAFSAPFLERGRQYFLDGKVQWLEDQNHVVRSRVAGANGEIYSCVVTVKPAAQDHMRISGQCSCPVLFNCKHVAATVLAAMERQEEQDDISFSAGLWLKHLARVAVPEEVEEAAECLIYLLRRDELEGGGVARLEAHKTRRLKSGGYGKTKPYGFTTPSRAAFIRESDLQVLQLMAAAAAPGDEMVELRGRLGGEIAAAAVATGRAYWEDPEDGLALVPGEPMESAFDWRLGEDGRLHAVVGGAQDDLVLLPTAPPRYVDLNTGGCGILRTTLPDPVAELMASAPSISPEEAEAVAAKVRASCGELPLPLPKPPERRKLTDCRPVFHLTMVSEERQVISPWHYLGATAGPTWADYAVFSIDYGGARVGPNASRQVLRWRAEDGSLVEASRDAAAERAALARLEEFGFVIDPADGGGEESLYLTQEDDRSWLEFIRLNLPLLEEDGWQVRYDSSFRFHLIEVDEWYADLEEPAGEDWFGLELGVEVGGQRINLLPLLSDHIAAASARCLQDLVPAGDADLPLRLADGRLLMLPAERARPILQTLVELCDPDALDKRGQLRMSRLRSPALESLDAAVTVRGGESLRRYAQRLQSFEQIEAVAPPASLNAELRGYQQRGVDWLQFLRQFDLGGILADDMGLGKTVQVLAHLLVEKESGRADRPSLVVAPTSLMLNWQRETARFAPSLKVLLLHGLDRRERYSSIGEHDVVLTTYPLLSRDEEILAEQEWHLLVLDEAQAIKNPRARAAQVVQVLRARHRLCLTGTPMENHLGELWSLLHFLMPGLLGDERQFRRIFRNPIERDGDRDRSDALRRRIAPFLLRREKGEVVSELPPKTEMLHQVQLEGGQRDLYETVRIAMHERVRAEISRKGLERSGIIVLDALLKLRQVCCDPRLLKLDAARRVKGSAKLELLMEMLPELVEEGRRVLLFSQFTSMLGLIEQSLTAHHIDHVKLTGQTRDRATPIDRFQNGEVPLFLISLKAGGAGLNLTAADTVIHYDPWWNPAVERQATDRAHRLGQEKPVFVYKLIAAGTVEERIQQMQARKQALADAMLAGGDQAGHVLTRDDVEILFAPLE